MTPPPLTGQQEAEAQRLFVQLQEASRDDLLARLLVSKPEAEIFGTTEFQVRTIVHRLGAKALTTHLAEKKTATSAPASSVATASKRRGSKATGRKRR